MTDYKFARWIAWKLPGSVLLWAFVRAYAFLDSPTKDYEKIYDLIVKKYNLRG